MILARHDNADREHEIAVERSSSREATGFVDTHCHCLPCLDDGPQSIDEAISLCRMLVEDNVHTVVATPHQLGRFEGRTSTAMIHKTTRLLNEELVERGIDLTVLPGAEVRLDERIVELLARHEVLTLADAGRQVLLELPWDIFIDVEPLLIQFVAEGVDLIIAHPERNGPLLEHRDAVQRWLSCGISLQVTASSLTGHFGPQAERSAWRLIAEGWVDTVATDAHDHRSHPPCMTMACEMVAAGFGPNLARRLCIENPSRIARGERLVPAGIRNRQEVW